MAPVAARMLGITEYIAKPIIPDKLLQILESPLA
jgi:hypothetical protein